MQPPADDQLHRVPRRVATVTHNIQILNLRIEAEKRYRKTGLLHQSTAHTRVQCIRIQEIGQGCRLTLCDQSILRARNEAEQSIQPSKAFALQRASATRQISLRRLERVEETVVPDFD